MLRKTILLLSNGFAEDTVGAALAKKLREIDPELSFLALPIVGMGAPYTNLGIPVIGPCRDLPSKGITYGKDFDLRAELGAGAIQLYFGKTLALIKRRREIDLVVGVGDFLSSVVSGVFVKKPFVYLWVTLSHFDGVAKHFLKKYAKMIFSRWRTWTHLPEFNVEYSGNPYMDVFEVSGADLGLDKSLLTIGVLPGSREPAYNNLPKICEALGIIMQKLRVNVVFGLSPQIEREKFLEAGRACAGWSEDFKVVYKFGDVISVADLVLGLAGTGNEQAAGLGKPVVTFWGGGHSRDEDLVLYHAEKFIQGAGLVLPPVPQEVAENILSLLSDPVKMKEMGQRGIELNGGNETLKMIAERIDQWLKKN